MNEAVKIRLQNDVKDSRNFGFLREEGLRIIRHMAATSWTDHNLHDPGITILEALSYALTQAGLISGLDMQDLLTSGETEAPQEFFTAAQVLPSAPVLLKDFQRLFIDHPLVKRAWVSLIQSEPFGRMSVLLEFEDLDNMDLNSNIVGGTVTVSGTVYHVDIVFPYWDDPEVLPLQQNITLTTVAFEPPANPWQPIAGSSAYFNRIKVNNGLPTTFNAWVVLLITTPVDTPADLPLVLQQAANLLLLLGDNSDADQSILKQYNRRVTMAFETSRRIRRYTKHYRNLCESIAEYRAVHIQEVAFTANIEVAPGTDVENLLVEIFFKVNSYVSPEITADSFNNLIENGQEIASVFEGPLLDYGFISDEQLNAGIPLNKLYVSDIMRIIIQLRNPESSDIQTREELTNRSIIAVSNVSLALYLDNRNIITGAMDCLQLINSSRHVPRLSVQKSHVTFRRNNIEVEYDINRVIALYKEKLETATASIVVETPDLPVPKGNSFPVGDFYPVQNDLPVTYGVGKWGLPATASEERRAQARQLKGFMFFYEQIIAGHFAQLAHINSFFSADPQVITTMYQQPIYQIPEIRDLFLSFIPGMVDPEADWQNFQADTDNPYMKSIRKNVETEEQFLERRHRMLDHLLARMGEEMQDYSALAFRENNFIANASALTVQELIEMQQKRRLQTLHQLLYDKSDYYYNLPGLNHSRAQAFGLPSWRRKGLITVIKILSASGDQFGWNLKGFSGNVVLRHAMPESSEAEARRKAEEVLSKATSAGSYNSIPDGVLFRVRLDFSATPGIQADAVSFNTFISAPNAIAAIPSIRNDLLRAWVEFGLAPIEARLYHLLGFAVKGERRKLINPLTDFFEIFDDPIPQKRFRLRATTDPGSIVLLESRLTYPDATQAQVAIHDAIKNGVLMSNYFIDPLLSPLVIELKGSDGNTIARTPATFPDMNIIQAQETAKQIRELLFRNYSLEGFYMMEHILLSPYSSGDPALIIKDSPDPCQSVELQRKDPYSFQVTFVFPSGYARDFNLPPPVVLHESQPDRFRDPEFRDYAERTIRKLCPAHILPVVIWVNRSLPNVVIPPGAACFDLFETAYRNWMTALFTDEVPEATIQPLRNALVVVLNRLFMENH